MKRVIFFLALVTGIVIIFSALKNFSSRKSVGLQPVIITEQTEFDTDDPAIWIDKHDPGKSLVIGTDKNSKGALYVFNLEGKIIREKTVPGLKRPNNVDVAYSLPLNGIPTDIAVVTERERSMIRIFALPSMLPLDNGGIPVFANETESGPMGIALYTRAKDSALFAIVSRPNGPREKCLWQYRLMDDGHGMVQAQLTRKFGKFSGKKEIESIAVDNEAGYVYYSDEGAGVHKYYADPERGDQELAFFGTNDFKEDMEGISIYKTTAGRGYILISNQQANQFMVYPREGTAGDPNKHLLIRAIDFQTESSDGSEVTNINLGKKFPRGLFVAMSENNVFKYFDWRQIEKAIEAK